MEDERRRSTDREFDRLRQDVKSLSESVQALVSSIKVFEEWRKSHDAYYQRETAIVEQSFVNVKADMLGHEKRISSAERLLEKHSVWVAVVSAVAIALLIVVVQRMALLKGG